MPVTTGKYKPSNPIFYNAHINTIYASLLRWIPKPKIRRERIENKEGDFLDLDWSGDNGKNLIVILAGLEGKSSSIYSKATYQYFVKNNWDVVCMNYRGCSGEPNRMLKGYHLGMTEDLKFTLEYIAKNHDYENIVLVGYSLGGNLALKYFGEENVLPSPVKACVCFSVPMDMKACNDRLDKWYNWHYLKWFMIFLNYKINKKKKQFPGKLDHYKGFFMSKNFSYFDQHYTAPVNDFKTVDEYYEKSSCLPWLSKINCPALVVCSEDDTFISENCYPKNQAKANPNLFLEINRRGGHCGFIRSVFEKDWWMQERTMEFIQSINKNPNE